MATIREQRPSKSSIIYINLPDNAIEALEASPTRKRIKAIKKCGTIVQETHNNIGDVKSKPTQKRDLDLRKNENLSIYNNNLYNNNIDRDLSSGEKQQNPNVVVNSNLHDEKSSSTTLSTTRKDNENKSSEISKSYNLTELDNSEILNNNQKIKALEVEIAPLLKQSSEIIKLKDKIGCAKMLSKLSEFNKNNRNLFEKELAMAKLRYSNEKIILSSMQSKFNSGLINDSEFKSQQIKTLEVKLQMLRSKSTNMMKEYDSTGDTRYLDEKHKIESQESTARLELQKLLNEGKPVEINKHHDYLHGKGCREFSGDLIDWLKNQISEILKTTDEKVILKIANEIAYQVRLGNLKISYQIGQEISTKHGVAIALKILRAGHWTRPSGMPRDGIKGKYVTYRKENTVNENFCYGKYQQKNSNVGVTSLVRSTDLLAQRIYQNKLSKH